MQECVAFQTQCSSLYACEQVASLQKLTFFIIPQRSGGICFLAWS